MGLLTAALYLQYLGLAGSNGAQWLGVLICPNLNNHQRKRKQQKQKPETRPERTPYSLKRVIKTNVIIQMTLSWSEYLPHPCISSQLMGCLLMYPAFRVNTTSVTLQASRIRMPVPVCLWAFQKQPNTSILWLSHRPHGWKY